MSNVWIITESSPGTMRALAIAVLQAGGRVVATTRNPEELKDMVEGYNDKFCMITVNVSDTSAVRAIDAAASAFGLRDTSANNSQHGSDPVRQCQCDFTELSNESVSLKQIARSLERTLALLVLLAARESVTPSHNPTEPKVNTCN